MLEPATPRAARQEQLAEWGQRVAAHLLDQLILVGGAGAVGVVVAVAARSATGGIGIALVVYLLAFVPYWVLFHASASGQTPGKRALRIALRNERGGRVAKLQSLARLAIFVVLGFVPFGSIVNALWPLWDARRQAIHDKAAKTIVVRT